VPAGCTAEIFAFIVRIDSCVVVRGVPVRAGAGVYGTPGVGVISAVTLVLCITTAASSEVSRFANGRKYELLIKSAGISCPVIPYPNPYADDEVHNFAFVMLHVSIPPLHPVNEIEFVP
jgi:hypothetical protein